MFNPFKKKGEKKKNPSIFSKILAYLEMIHEIMRFGLRYKVSEGELGYRDLSLMYIEEFGDYPNHLKIGKFESDFSGFYEELEKLCYKVTIIRERDWGRPVTHLFEETVATYRHSYPNAIYAIQVKENGPEIYLQVTGNFREKNLFEETKSNYEELKEDLLDYQEMLQTGEVDEITEGIYKDKIDSIEYNLCLPTVELVEICYGNEDLEDEDVDVILDCLRKFKLTRIINNKTKTRYQILTYNEHSKYFSTRSVPLQSINLIRDINLNYNNLELKDSKNNDISVSMKNFANAVTSTLTDPEGKGLLAIGGLPGTGKTRLLEHIVYKISSKVPVLKVNSSIIKLFAEPSFQNFIHTWGPANYGAVLWFEDGDPLIQNNLKNENGKVTGSRSSELSELLNIIDGPLFKAFGFKVIMTYNIEYSGIDFALNRPGRAMFGQEINIAPLKREKVLELGDKNPEINLEKLEAYMEGKENATLAEIYNTCGYNTNLTKLEKVLGKLVVKPEPKETKEVEEIEKTSSTELID